MMADEVIGETTVIPNPHPAAAQPAPTTGGVQPNASPVNVNVTYPAQAASVIAPVSPASPAGDIMMSIPKTVYDQYQQGLVELGRVRAEKEAEISAAKVKEATALAKAGEAERAVQILQDKALADLTAEKAQRTLLEERAKRYALDGELARALSSQPLVPGGAEQLTELFRGKFVVEPEGDTFKVRTHQTFEPVGAFIAAQLGRPEFAHFVRAQNPQGGIAGTGGQGTTPTPSATPATNPEPRNLSDAIILGITQNQKAAVDGRFTGGSTINEEGKRVAQPSAGFGLRAKHA